MPSSRDSYQPGSTGLSFGLDVPVPPGRLADLSRFSPVFVDASTEDTTSLNEAIGPVVTANPAPPDIFAELERLREACDGGAALILTAPVLDNRDFLDFREHCARAGIRAPLLAAVRPVTTREQVRALAKTQPCVRLPSRLLRGFDRAGGDPEMVRRVGLHHAAEQCLDFCFHGVEGLHLHTGDDLENVFDIMNRIGWGPA